MYKKVIFLVLVLSVLFTVNAGAEEAINFPDVKGHWASESIKVLSEQGIINGWDGLFHPEERVRVNEYIKMIVTALGHTDVQNYPNDWARNYIEKAFELGIIVEGEITDFKDYINRGMMAKIAMRALNNEDVPDYIDAYKGLLTDYNDLHSNIKLDALKCVAIGVIKGMPDGSFKPSYYSTRAEAATVIHRMISQEEREKAKPVFATPDPEFEAFMASEEAEQYCSTENILKIVDGKVIFGGEYSGYQVSTGDRLVYTYFNKEANKEVYEVLRDIIMCARQNGHYVRTFLSVDNTVVRVLYFDEAKYGLGPNWYTTANFELSIMLEPSKYNKSREQYSYYNWTVGTLMMQTSEDWEDVNYREPVMTKALETAIKSIYTGDLGQRMFDFVIREYDKERNEWFNKSNKEFRTTFNKYMEDLEGLEVYYDDGHISTNKNKL